MQTVLLVIYLMVVVALIGVVLIQRSEGGGLGIGGGSGFMSARGTANALTRTTAILATLFFVISLALGVEGSHALAIGGRAFRPFWSIEYQDAVRNAGDARINYVVRPVSTDYLLGARSQIDDLFTLLQDVLQTQD